VVGLGADYVNHVSEELGGERLHILQWQGDPARYIASALGLGYLPPIELIGSNRLANVLLGDIDVRGTRARWVRGVYKGHSRRVVSKTRKATTKAAPVKKVASKG
jgi:hypothetical protein